MDHVDLSVLRTFMAIVEEQTFAKASGRVHRTQAAVSQQMRRLESQLGVTLFQRAGRNNELTAKGQQLTEYAKRILQQHDDLMLAMNNTAQTSPIRIGAEADLAETVLPRFLRRFARISGSTPMQLHVGRSLHLLEALNGGLIDLALSTRWDKDLPSVVVQRSPVVWIAAQDYRLLRGMPVPLVLVEAPSIFRNIALDALERAGKPWTDQVVSTSFAGVRAAVKAGLGVTVRSIQMVNSEMKVLGEQEDLPPLGTINYYFYVNEKSPNRLALPLFRDVARSITGDAPL